MALDLRRGTRGALRAALRRARLRDLDGELSGRARQRGRERDDQRLHRAQDPRAGRGPAIAEKLIPKDHGFGTRRVPLETNYYEVYNQDNVRLVDLQRDADRAHHAGGTQDFKRGLTSSTSSSTRPASTPSPARSTASTSGAKAGSDSPTSGRMARDLPRHAVRGFPNLFAIVGPHNAAMFCNIPRCIEHNVEWVTEFIRHMRDNGLHARRSEQDAERAWTAHVERDVQDAADDQGQLVVHRRQPERGRPDKSAASLYMRAARRRTESDATPLRRTTTRDSC